MRYGLLVVTHGEAPHLTDTLLSFDRYVSPSPTARLAVVDGPDSRLPDYPSEGAWETVQHGEQEGFCAACRTGWEVARAACRRDDLDAIFWLENDFRFLRPVPLPMLLRVMDRWNLAQMALPRQPLAPREKQAGSVIGTVDHTQMLGWVQHHGFFTTNPSLIPSVIFDAVDWPDGPECEGKMGITLRDDLGVSFGYMGEAGEEWVEHLGVRSATGKGY